MSLTGKRPMTVRRACGLRALLFVARLLALFLALQVSGTGPLLWGDCCSADGDDCSGESDRKPCNDCPPGCPKCHCAQTPFGAPPPVEADRPDLATLEGRADWTPYEAEVPREAPLSSIFRPPKLG